MARSRKSAAAGADPRPIVTYSHMPADLADGRVEPRGLDPDAAIIDAVEVPLVADGEPQPRGRRAPDLRADAREDAFDAFDPGEAIAAALEPRRRRGGGLLALILIVALAGGAGAVAASLGVFAPREKAAPASVAADPAAEMIAIHKQIDALGAATTPEAQAELARLTKRLAELEQSGAVVPAAAEAAPSGDIGPAVRQISLTPESAEDAGASAATPPAPRLRPEKAAPAVADLPAASEEGVPVAEPILPHPPRVGVKAVALPAAPQPATGDGDDSFIASVEKALAKSEGDGTPAAAPAPVTLGAPPHPLVAPDAGADASLPPPQPLSPAGMAPLPHLDANAADPYALPSPMASPAEPARPAKLPPGVKLPPADIPNVAPDDQQY